MTVNPVMSALIAARQSQLNKAESQLAEQVDATLGPKPPDTYRPARFIRWCEDQSLPWRPATPSAIASFVLGHTKPGNTVEELRTLSLAHTTQGLPDPTAAWQVTKALLRLTGADVPRSWPDSEKAKFLMLPPDLQQYLSIREKDRDIAVRRAQTEAGDLRNDAALWRKRVETEKLKEKNGTTEKPDETRVA